MGRTKRNVTVQNGTVLPNPDELTDRQERVAVLLATGHTVAAASRECKLGTTTVWRWLREDGPFPARVAALRKELTDRAVGRLADMMATSAADSLRGLLGAKSEAVRLDAVRAVYDLFINVINAADLKARIEQLEAGHADRIADKGARG